MGQENYRKVDIVNIYKEIKRLINYGIDKNLIEPIDEIYTRNKILDILHLNEYQNVEANKEDIDSPQEILNNILDFAYREGIIEKDNIIYRDILDTKIMDCFLPRPSEINAKFRSDYEISPEIATNNYYRWARHSNYIRMDRIKRNASWKFHSKYGLLDITINLSKPEKDPKDIEKEKSIKKYSYPKCLLCKENVGYSGRIDYPARCNHRIIPIQLRGENWFLQYSPYVYYNEHAIIFKDAHVPMKISKETFERLLDFISIFSHYFIGSNADLPIVGGSILNHDHFQGGRYEFAMEKASILKEMHIEGYQDIEEGIIKWRLSVIRIRGKNKKRLVELADLIHKSWQNYEDKNVHIIPYTGSEPHNTITPIGRYKNDKYELDLTLRNNRRSREYPDGIFHPHKEFHHIKKENIGLIEVMGLAVLPARLLSEFNLLRNCFSGNKSIERYIELDKHKPWYYYLKEEYKGKDFLNEEILKYEVGKKFEKILEDTGVFKQEKEGLLAFEKFMKSLNKVQM